MTIAPCGHTQQTPHTNCARGAPSLLAHHQLLLSPCLAVFCFSFYFGMFQTSVLPGSFYDFRLAASNPAITRLHFRSGDEREAILVRFFYTQPLVLEVLVGGQLFDNDNLIAPTLDSPGGDSQFNPQARFITLLLRGSADPAKRIYSIVQKPLVQVTIAFAVDLPTFLGPKLVSNLAMLLSIDPSRIRIVSVQPGSTIVKLQIADEQPTTADPQEFSAQVSAELEGFAGNGSLNVDTIGYDVISLHLTPPTLNQTGNGTATGRDVPIVPRPLKRSVSHGQRIRCSCCPSAASSNRLGLPHARLSRV